MGWEHWVDRGGAIRRGLASALAVLAVGLIGVATSLPAGAQIANSKHNLGSTGTGVNKFSGTAEICVFCHTPHGADTSAAVPLWNRTLPAPTSFQTYDSLGTSTLDGRVAPVGSVSIACLSCHDGVTSMSAVINAPGSGTTGDAAWQAGAWTGANQTAGKISAGLITNIGQDLRNDHPIGIQYGGGGITATAPTAATRDVDFKRPATQVIGTTRVWWVDTEGTPNNTRQKTDMMLYTRAPATGYTGQTDSEPFVECASCHDPHNSTNSTFLRISNAGSAVCLSCHVK
ncbi:MAG TPA: cytochrome c3 family protein [Ramlibacter sp.]|nr:cytochrome c3 family protein [Ramlibacter sp.]